MANSLDNFKRTMQRARNVASLHNKLHGKRGRPEQEVSDVLRGAVVLAVGALDGLVLESSIQAAPLAAKRGLLGERASRWAREFPEEMVAALAAEDPTRAFADLIRRKTESMTFQRSAMIEDHLRGLLGAGAPWEYAASSLGMASPSEVKKMLDEFVDRRNRIAHSGDTNARGTTEGITVQYVNERLGQIEKIGEAVWQVINERVGKRDRILSRHGDAQRDRQAVPM